MRILTTSSSYFSRMALSACGAIRESARKSHKLVWQRPLHQKLFPNKQQPTNPLISEAKSGLVQNETRPRCNVYLGTPIDQVTNLVIERVPGGAVIRATGLTAVQGVFLGAAYASDRRRDTGQRCSDLSLGRHVRPESIGTRCRLNAHAHSRCGTCFDGPRAGRRVRSNPCRRCAQRTNIAPPLITN